MSQKNENKLTFKGLFLTFLKNTNPGDFVSDNALKEVCVEHGLHLGTKDIQGCIRQLETIIGDTYKIRAVRIRNEGYKIFAGEDQYIRASKEGRDKLLNVARKTSKRFGAINLNKLPADLRMTVTSKKMALDSLAHIVKGVMSRHNLEIKDVNVLSSAANELKALEQLKKLG